jgi:hypothetical protein
LVKKLWKTNIDLGWAGAISILTIRGRRTEKKWGILVIMTYRLWSNEEKES